MAAVKHDKYYLTREEYLGFEAEASYKSEYINVGKFSWKPLSHTKDWNWKKVGGKGYNPLFSFEQK